MNPADGPVRCVSRHYSRASRGQVVQHAGMLSKLCIFVGTTLGGYAFYAAGDALGLGFGWSFALSGLGSLVGVYAGWKLARRLQ